MCKFYYMEMSKNKNTTQSSLEELYTTNYLALLKRVIIELNNKQNNTPFLRNRNASNA